MIAECEQAQVKLAIGYRCQFEPHHQECMRLAREKKFGEIRQIDASFGFRFGDYRLGDLRRWRLEMEYAGGGALMDVGIYALQACRYLTGEEPTSVSAREIKTDPVKFAEVDETILWNMEFPSGIVANCATTYKFSGMNSFTAFADNGKFGMTPAFGYGGNQGFAGSDSIDKPQIDQFAAEMDDFAKVVKQGGKSIVSGEEGLRDLIVVDAIYQAASSGRSVQVG
jgi:predicted dehydrogenase